MPTVRRSSKPRVPDFALHALLAAHDVVSGAGAVFLYRNVSAGLGASVIALPAPDGAGACTGAALARREGNARSRLVCALALGVEPLAR